MAAGVTTVSRNVAPSREPLPEQGGLLLYPNPASGTVNLWITDARQYLQCRISDLLGRTVMTVDLATVLGSDGRYLIDISRLPRNHYLLMLIGGQGTVQRTLITK